MKTYNTRKLDKQPTKKLYVTKFEGKQWVSPQASWRPQQLKELKTKERKIAKDIIDSPIYIPKAIRKDPLFSFEFCDV